MELDRILTFVTVGVAIVYFMVWLNKRKQHRENEIGYKIPFIIILFLLITPQIFLLLGNLAE